MCRYNYGVRFEERPHTGKVYPAKKCKIAKKEFQQWGPINSKNLIGQRQI